LVGVALQGQADVNQVPLGASADAVPPEQPVWALQVQPGAWAETELPGAALPLAH
jgi:hypothetical protein